MRHGVKKAKLNRNLGERKALVRSLLIALFTHEKIVTTEPKAKLLKREADKIISRAKTHDVATKRHLLATLPDPVVVQKLLDQYGPRFQGRNGGYSRIIHLGRRLSDASKMARIELLAESEGVIVSETKKEVSTEAKETTVAKPKAKKTTKAASAATKKPAAKKAKIATKTKK